MSRTNQTISTMAAAVLLMVVLPSAANAQVDTSDWVCESCPFDEGYRADYEAGATYVSDDAARFGNATGYDKEGGYVNLDGDGSYASDGYNLEWYVEDLGLDSRVAELEAGRQGKYGFYFGYRELPYRLFDTTATVFSAGSPDSLVLPDSWVYAGNTSGFSDLDNSLRQQDIGSDRQIIDVGGKWLPTRKFSVYADYRRQNRDGLRITGGSGLTQSSLLPRAFEFETDQMDLGLSYKGSKGSITLAYYGSFFKNKNASLTWDSPFLSSAGAEQLRMAQEPDNEFQQVSLSGAYYADFWDSVFAFSAASGRGKQNAGLLPYTINPNINAGALPQSSLNGTVDTINYAFTAVARPTDRLRLKAAYRLDERDNQTPQSDWQPILVDLIDPGITESNTPYSFKRGRLNLSANMRVASTLRVSAGFDRTQLDRDFQEVAEQTENSGWGQLRWRPSNGLDVRARAGASKREIDRYDETVAQSVRQNPLMRKYNLAYRYREFAEVTVAAEMLESPFSISATVLAADDSYTESPLGMTGGDELRATLDLGWTISETSSAYLMFGSETVKASQLGSQQFADADWSATHDDSFNHIGLGVSWRQIADKLNVRLDYSHGVGNTEIQVDSASFGGVSQLPDLESTLDSLRLEGAWRWSDRLDLTFNIRYESFSTEDWSLQDVAPDTLPTILTLGADPYDYEVWLVGAGFRFKFGAENIALPN